MRITFVIGGEAGRLLLIIRILALRNRLSRALEHDKPIVLFQMACQHLKSERIVRPGVTTLERMVITSREQAEHETYRRLQPLLTEELCARLDQVLVPDTAIKRTPLVWLRQGAVSFPTTETLLSLTFNNLCLKR